jgi:amino acid permease
MIQDGDNGYLTADISVCSLIATMNKFLENPSSLVEIRNNAVKKNMRSKKKIAVAKNILIYLIVILNKK